MAYSGQQRRQLYVPVHHAGQFSKDAQSQVKAYLDETVMATKESKHGVMRSGHIDLRRHFGGKRWCLTQNLTSQGKHVPLKALPIRSSSQALCALN